MQPHSWSVTRWPGIRVPAGPLSRFRYAADVTPAERQRLYRQRHGQPVPPLHRRCRCGRSLDGHRPQAAYCSDTCRQAARRERVSRPPAARLHDVAATGWDDAWTGCLVDGPRIYWRCLHTHENYQDACACAEIQALTTRS
jgi:hypothetical protein